MVSQIFAIVIFVLMFALIIMDKIPRHWVTLGCGLATIVIVFAICMKSPSAIMETLNVKSIFTLEFWHTSGQGNESSSGINWATIIFIAGMMVMVEGMAKAGFFRWLCLTIAKAVKYKVMPILVTFMIMSAVLSMFIDSITVILFLAAVTVELSQLLKFSPVPMVLAEIFCANLGGSATMCGDPPNIIIGTALGYSFADFLTNTGLIAGIALIAIIVFFFFAFKKELSANKNEKVDPSTFPNPSDAIENIKDFIISTVIFIIAIVLLVSHAQTGLTVAFIGVAIALITLLTSFKDIGSILKKVDYKTLLFFIGLFILFQQLQVHLLIIFRLPQLWCLLLKVWQQLLPVLICQFWHMHFLLVLILAAVLLLSALRLMLSVHRLFQKQVTRLAGENIAKLQFRQQQLFL